MKEILKLIKPKTFNEILEDCKQASYRRRAELLMLKHLVVNNEG